MILFDEIDGHSISQGTGLQKDLRKT